MTPRASTGTDFKPLRNAQLGVRLGLFPEVLTALFVFAAGANLSTLSRSANGDHFSALPIHQMVSGEFPTDISFQSATPQLRQW
jgi:hypothetical protein